MKRFLILFSLSLTLSFAQIDQYWQVDRYFKKFPKEKIKFEQFKEIVKNDPQKITSPNKPVKIVMVYPGNQISDYWRRSKISFEKRLKKLDIQYTLEDHFTKPGTVSQQAKYLIDAIKRDTDYLIFTLDAAKHSKFIETIISRKKPKLILQNITTPLREWGDIQPFLYVGFDHKIGSLKLAEYFIKKTGGKGKYAVLYGTQGYVSSMRGDEFIKYIKNNSDLKLVESYYTDFDKQKAYNAAKQILKKHSDIDFIYSCSTDISHGAIDAIKQSGLGKPILINGWGGGSSEIEALQNGSMDITVLRINDDNGIAMAEAIKLDLEQKQNKVPLIFSGDMEILKKGISQQDLENLKQKAFRYSN